MPPAARPASRPPFALTPEERVRRRPAELLVKAVSALIRAQVAPGRSPEKALAAMFSDDGAGAELIMRAAISGATTTDPAWAGSLAQQAVGDFLGGLEAPVAFGQLLRLATNVPTEGRATVLPNVAASPAAAAFIAEAGVIPCRQLAVTTATLGPPKKIASIAVMTHEIAKASNLPAIVSEVLGLSVGLKLDEVLLGDDAATDAQPAGIRAGVAAITATAGGGVDAMLADLINLGQAVSGIGGPVVLVADPSTAVALSLRSTAGPLPYAAVLASASLEAGTLIALNPKALAVIVDGVPEVEISEDTIVHMSDTPTNFSLSTSSVAHPSVSMLQTAQLAVRVILGVNWSWRTSPGAVAWTSGITWA